MMKLISIFVLWIFIDGGDAICQCQGSATIACTGPRDDLWSLHTLVCRESATVLNIISAISFVCEGPLSMTTILPKLELVVLDNTAPCGCFCQYKTTCDNDPRSCRCSTCRCDCTAIPTTPSPTTQPPTSNVPISIFYTSQSTSSVTTPLPFTSTNNLAGPTAKMDSSPNNTSVIIGSAIGSFSFFGIMIGAVYVYFRHRRRQQRKLRAPPPSNIELHVLRTHVSTISPPPSLRSHETAYDSNPCMSVENLNYEVPAWSEEVWSTTNNDEPVYSSPTY